jgi:translation elongation factor EF-1alpha
MRAVRETASIASGTRTTLSEEEDMGAKIGTVTHYFGKIQVAVLDLSSELKVGDHVHFQGSSTDFTQEVSSMQIEHENIDSAGPGAEVALKVKEKVREGDEVLKVED